MQPIKLRGGAWTRDPRLDRVAQNDPRNRKYSVEEVVERKLRSYTWSIKGQLDQGQEGACVGFAWGQELMARPAPVAKIDNAFAREKIYWEAQKIDPWEGGDYPDALPNYEGTSVLAGVKVLKSLGAMEEYRWGFSLNDVLAGVGLGPGVLGLNWYEGMMHPDAEGYIAPTGNWVGGHAILLRGVSLKRKHVLLQNSWGSEWGNNGSCLLRFEHLERLLGENGDACFLVNRKLITV